MCSGGDDGELYEGVLAGGQEEERQEGAFHANHFVFCGQCFVWVACGLVLLLVVFVNSRKRVVPMRLT